MGVGLHARGDADHHPSCAVQFSAQLLDTIDLVQGVDDDPPHSRVQGQPQFVDGLVVAMHPNAFGIHAPLKGGDEFPTRADVHAQPQVVHPPGNGSSEECLAGVVDVPSVEGLSEGRGTSPKILLVEDVESGSLLLGELDDGHSSHLQSPLLVPGDGGAPQFPVKGVDVSRHREPGGAR